MRLKIQPMDTRYDFLGLSSQPSQNSPLPRMSQGNLSVASSIANDKAKAATNQVQSKKPTNRQLTTNFKKGILDQVKNKSDGIVVPEEIDKDYLNYYKDYKDGINESTLDRFRHIVSRRQ